MSSARSGELVGHNGQPLHPRIQQALRRIQPRLQQRFHSLDDEALVADVLEEAGQRITDVEESSGLVRNLSAYAWTTVLNVARSRLRRSSMRLVHATLASEEVAGAWSSLRSRSSTAEQIETHVLIEQLLAQLTADERLICTWKQLGFSSREIAAQKGTSVASVDTLFHRIKRKVRAVLDAPAPCGASDPSRQRRRIA